MVFAAVGDLESTVDLLEQHHARELMRKGHGRHGQTEVGLCFDSIGQTEGTADDKYNRCRTVDRSFFNLTAEGFGREHFPLNAHGKHIGAMRDQPIDLDRLFFERVENLRVRRVVGQSVRRNLDNLQSAEGLQTFFVLRDRIAQIRFLQLAERYNPNSHHSSIISGSPPATDSR